jgi:TRAP-type C4-dicarboxylate transport system permease small subunit
LLDALIDRTCRLFGAAMVACLALMVAMVFGNVVLRYGFNSGITASEELSRWLFVWMTFLGAVVAVRRHLHLGTDALVSRLPRGGKKACYVLSHLLMLALCAFMLRGAWQQAVINYGTTSAVMEASMAWLYAAGVVFSVLAALVIAAELWKLMAGQVSDEQLVTVAESDDFPHGDPRPADVSRGGTLHRRAPRA